MGDKPVPCPCLEVIQAHLGDVETIVRERDQARAEVETLKLACDEQHALAVHHIRRGDSKSAEVERLRGLLRRSAAWVNVVAEMGEIDDEDDVSDLADLRRNIEEALK